MRFRSMMAACSMIALMHAASSRAVDLDHQVSFSIPAQPLDAAVVQFSRQAKIQIVMASADLSGRNSDGLSGTFTVADGLQKLLKDSGLEFKAIGRSAISIGRFSASLSGGKAADSSATLSLTGAQTSAGNSAMLVSQAEAPKAATDTSSSISDANERTSLDEIVVTGSHIAGQVPIGSPILTFDQSDFMKVGAATAQDFFATIPQNFGGGRNQTTRLETASSPDFALGSSVNIHGLGSSSSLVLVNGHRTALAGSADYTDISLIPLGAVERIDLLTDGASAIYGSDAIGGVVNFVMRKTYDGVETRLNMGTDANGKGSQVQAAQTFGRSWDAGNALLSYEYYNRNALNCTDREFCRDAVGPAHGPADLFPNQIRNSVYFAINQAIDKLHVDFDANYSNRTGRYKSFDFYNQFINQDRTDTSQYGASLTLIYGLGSDWTAELGGNASRNIDTDVNVAAPAFGGETTEHTRYNFAAFDAKISGGLLDLPAGRAKFALGAEHRSESFESSDAYAQFGDSARVNAAFAEIYIPMAPAFARSNTPLVSGSVAGRYEKYSNFGSTINPKLGLQIAPADSIRLRGSYGTSFKAPSFYETSPYNAQNILFDVPDPASPSGTTRTIILTGNNPDLRPEKATTWTGGLDLPLQTITGVSGSLTYFSTRYSGRIGPLPTDPFTEFNDPNFSQFVIRRSSVGDARLNALIAQLLSGRTRIGLCAVPLDPGTGACPEPASDFGAVEDSRIANAAATNLSGLDLNLTRHDRTALGDLDFALNAEYLLDYSVRASSTAIAEQFANTVGNPLRLKIRGDATFSRQAWNVTVRVNYQNDYTNRGRISAVTGLPLPFANISSWTTVDLNTGYTFGSSGWLRGATVVLDVQNLFNRNPPSFSDEAFGLGYDPTNASPLGRYISLLVKKAW